MSWDGSNRRKFARAAFPCLIKIRCEKKDKEVFLTHTENLSFGGVRVILKDPIDLGVIIDLDIDLMDAGEVLKCRGQVVWLDKRKKDCEFKPDFYDIGIEFQNIDEANKERLEVIVNHYLKKGRQE